MTVRAKLVCREVDIFEAKTLSFNIVLLLHFLITNILIDFTGMSISFSSDSMTLGVTALTEFLLLSK
jgi:hypothetical protein